MLLYKSRISHCLLKTNRSGGFCVRDHCHSNIQVNTIMYFCIFVVEIKPDEMGGLDIYCADKEVRSDA